MAEAIEKPAVADAESESRLEALLSAVEDAGAIPKGTIDPVYEAKARVLNRAVSTSRGHGAAPMLWKLTILSDPGNWNGMVSMAAVYCRRFWVGERQYVADRHESYLYVSAFDTWSRFLEFPCHYFCIEGRDRS
jgi:hypothetical protein